ncbi:hypothetical protein [Carnobacterium sp.]|uniref:hypothetical protein n=1 Tax=Carnobacterium sp. TaxID=48221 RepID=UPI00388EC5CE
MKLEFINIILGIIASGLSIYSLVKSKKSEDKVENLTQILNDAGIEINFASGKKSKQVVAKGGSVGFMGNKNSINYNRSSEDDENRK